MHPRVPGLVILLAMMAPAVAEDRFYPIMGPDGRLQMIRSMPQSQASTAAAGPSAATPGVAASGSAPASAVASESAPASAVAPASAPTVGDAELPAFAPYDSEHYADSEVLEQAADPDAGKKRFYSIDDGMGPRLNEFADDRDETGAPPVMVAAPVPEEPFYPVPSARRELDAAGATQRFPGLPACMPADSLESLQSVEPGLPATLVMDKGTYKFLDASRVVEAYHVAGAGLRTLVSRSYSRKDKKPAFAHPHLAFLAENGCVTRVVSGYYERLYPATSKRHSMLRADLTVHTEEAYVLVLAPRGSEEIASFLPYGYSSYGQLKFTLKK